MNVEGAGDKFESIYKNVLQDFKELHANQLPKNIQQIYENQKKRFIEIQMERLKFWNELRI